MVRGGTERVTVLPAATTAPRPSLNEEVGGNRYGISHLHGAPAVQLDPKSSLPWRVEGQHRTYGVTVHRMSPRIDAGPIAYSTTFDVDGAATGFTLTADGVPVGVPLILQLVQVAAEGPAAIPAIEQDVRQRKYFGREVPRNGALIWSESASHIDRFVRAFDYCPFSSSWGPPHATALTVGDHGSGCC